MPDYLPDAGNALLANGRQGRRPGLTEETQMASFSVVSNISAANAQANLATTNIGLQKALARLSSGFRINMAGDDAAGLAVANGYRSEVSVLNQGMRNAGDTRVTYYVIRMITSATPKSAPAAGR